MSADAAPAPLRVVLLLPLEQPLLKRAANVVRDGAAAVFASRKGEVSVSECAYATDAVLAAYERCVDKNTHWVIGPLSRADVAALAAAKPAIVRPTLMLSPLGTTPPVPMAVLSPDLESEAEAIAQQAGEDACRKPLVVEASSAIAARVASAYVSGWRERNAIALARASLASRERWRRDTDGWRQSGIDCVLFAGGSATLQELRPYLRNMAVYITSASFESALERTLDWTGVRIADSPWVVDPDRAEFARYAAGTTTDGADGLSPTLARLYALGVDAARLVLAAGRDSLPAYFDGAIGHLKLRDAQYRRTPAVGEFRERSLVRISP